MKGRSALMAVYNEEGMERGSVPMNGTIMEGEDSWRDLEHVRAVIHIKRGQ